MNKFKRRKNDLISEEEYTAQMLRKSDANPELDSPGDSEDDATAEFMMGMDYTPERSSLAANEDELEEEENFIPEKARVVSSQRPSPLSDLDRDADTN